MGGDCDAEVTTETGSTAPVPAPTAVTQGYTLSYSSISVAENEGTRNYTIALNIESTAKMQQSIPIWSSKCLKSC